MNNIKVRTKLVIVMVIALIALALCTVISNTSLSGLGNNALDIIENDMRSSYDEQIKAQVDNVISLCQGIYNRYEKGEYTLDEAEKLAADQIRDLRYGNNGYFWVDTYDGTNVVLLGNDTEGTNRMMQWTPMDLRICRQSSVQEGRKTAVLRIMYSRERVRRSLLQNVLTARHLSHLAGYLEPEITRTILMMMYWMSKMNFLPMNPTAEWRSSESLLSWK